MSNKLLSEITPEDLTAAHLALEDQLVEMRDDRMWVWIGGRPPGNGLVIREKDGSDSHLIRIPTRMAIEMAIKAILERAETPT